MDRSYPHTRQVIKRLVNTSLRPLVHRQFGNPSDGTADEQVIDQQRQVVDSHMVSVISDTTRTTPVLPTNRATLRRWSTGQTYLLNLPAMDVRALL